MKTAQSLLSVFGLVAAANAWGKGWNDTTSVVWTTVTTDIYTTYCPQSTTFTQGTKTYTATASETLTITDCPCTISHTVTRPTWSSTTSAYVPPPSNATWVPPVWITTTETVSEYTTYCPAPTSLVQGNQTYTVTEATTLTVTNCPCTKTYTQPATTVIITVGTTSTYCPAPTTITTGGTTITVSTTGYVTVPICSTTTVPVSSTTVVVGSTSVYCPTTTAVVTGGSTYSYTASTSGYVTVPVLSTSVYPVITPTPSVSTKSYGTSAVTTPKTGPTPTTSGPVLVSANAAPTNVAGLGVFAAAGLAAMLL